MNSYNLVNAKVYINHKWQEVNIGIKGDKIVGIGKVLAPSKETIDLKGHKIIPGLIDPHVHFDLDLGFIRSKDDFDYGSKAGVYGGITTIVDFLAPARNAAELKEFYDLRCQEAKDCHINYHFHACIRNPNGDLEEFVKMMKSLGMNTLKLFTTYSDSDRRTYDNQIIELLKLSKKYKFLILVHAENDELIKTSDTAKNIEISEYRNAEVETSEVLKLAQYVRQTKGYMYIVHTSCGNTVRLIKEQYKDILHKHFWMESCPQYFLLNKNLLANPNGNLLTFAPPLRSEDEEMLLRENINTISTIGTDHCAFMKADKDMYPLLCKHPFGIGGIEYSFLLLHALFGDKIIDKMSKNIAKLDSLEKIGEIKVGYLANLTIFKSTKPWTLNKGHGKVDYSVYEGMRVKEVITHTMVNGKFNLRDEKYISQKGRKI